ncbi:MAG: hypothetical protein H0W50_11580 [Parachlamydiaceae bacterium]|nr:hypothetical protein [Parachlamydiaceae bacterium]
MKKQMLLNFLILAIFSTLSLFSATPKTNQLNVDPKLSQYVKTIQAFPEGKKLISNILAEGQLNIQVGVNGVARNFKACWNQDSRTIIICLATNPPQGEVIASILFELHNASVTSKMDNLDQMAQYGKINKQEYVRSFEHLEYLNSINTANLAKIGIEKGLFPKNALLPTYKNFDEHFYYQKISGHSDVIAKNYDILMAPAREIRYF